MGPGASCSAQVRASLRIPSEEVVRPPQSKLDRGQVWVPGPKLQSGQGWARVTPLQELGNSWMRFNRRVREEAVEKRT